MSQLYPTIATLPLASLGAGEFSLQVTHGADKVAFEGGGATLTGKDLAKANLTTLAPSTKADDVHVDILHRAPSEKKLTGAASVDLTVRAPHHLELLGTDHKAEGADGFDSVTYMRVFDNLNEPMPFIDANEDFTVGKLEPGTDKAWGESLASRHKGQTVTRGNAVFQDNYKVSPSGATASLTPAPSNPKSPLGQTLVLTFEHDWFVGSSSTGKGVHVSHHIGRFYSDHAEYTKFTSPVASAGTSAKPPAATPQTKPAKGKAEKP